jgi:hypothetical protein
MANGSARPLAMKDNKLEGANNLTLMGILDALLNLKDDRCVSIQPRRTP